MPNEIGTHEVYVLQKLDDDLSLVRCRLAMMGIDNGPLVPWLSV